MTLKGGHAGEFNKANFAGEGQYESSTSRPKFTSKVLSFLPPKTGSTSGFIRPIPPAKLCARRAFP